MRAGNVVTIVKYWMKILTIEDNAIVKFVTIFEYGIIILIVIILILLLILLLSLTTTVIIIMVNWDALSKRELDSD
jgi:hypothetical protein